MKEQTIETAMPIEVAQIAQNVSVEKRNEVQSVLNHVFNGVSKMREQLDTVVVSDENDRTNMKLANTIRLGVRQVRLDAEKTFDAKRAEVQAQMLSYKTEDQLWLKAKQTMQILTKEIEEQARWKEETKIRFEAEQKELSTKQRMLKVHSIAPEIPRSEFENMSDSVFEMFFSGIEKAHIERIEAEKKAEQDRIEKERLEAEERERMRIENERLKKEAEEKERQLAAERAKAEAERKVIEEQARKEREDRERVELELRKKREEEERLRKEAEKKAADELRAKQQEEKRAKAAPDKAKLKDLAERIDNMLLPELKSEEANKILSDTKTLLAKVSTFIREKSDLI